HGDCVRGTDAPPRVDDRGLGHEAPHPEWQLQIRSHRWIPEIRSELQRTRLADQTLPDAGVKGSPTRVPANWAPTCGRRLKTRPPSRVEDLGGAGGARPVSDFGLIVHKPLTYSAAACGRWTIRLVPRAVWSVLILALAASGCCRGSKLSRIAQRP